MLWKGGGGKGGGLFVRDRNDLSCNQSLCFVRILHENEGETGYISWARETGYICMSS